jgi:DNA-binding CsgD family transcriptional regulator
MRRTILAAPVALNPGSDEYAVVRRAGVGRRTKAVRKATGEVTLAAALDLANPVLAAVAPEGVTLALLVVDRATRAPDAAEIALVEAAAALVASELARVVQRVRVGEMVAELRSFSTMAIALAGEVLDAPTSLPRDRGHGATFSGLDGGAVAAGQTLESLFSERERRVAALLVEGRSNREIAEVLVVSPETVKTHVARILRKLGAANRVEAVTRYLKLVGGA